MSNDATRAAIAAALSTVSGVTGYPRRPTVFKGGDGWPQWGGSERDAGQSWIETWRVLVILPSGEQSADVFADTHQFALINALRPVLFIDSFAPVNVPGEAGEFLALLIIGRCE